MRLHVCLEGRLAATLESSGSQARVSYTEAWLADPGSYPLSQSLPLQPTPLTGAPVINYLWGLLPDNAKILDTWARQFRVSARNPVALLAHVGEDCAGAVQFVCDDRLQAVLGHGSAGAASVDWLDETALERRIRHLAQDAGAARESADEGQFSLSGAQSKTALHFDARRSRWGIPRGRTPTTHILKPASNDFDGFAENEHFCLTLARRVGLAAATTAWASIGGVPTLICERYDRVQIEGRWHRIHQEDCCQALGIPPDSKYENEGGPGFARIMSLLDACDDPAADRDRLMRTACLVYLLAATDSHAKNFSLLHGRGTNRPGMRLAPLYDIASAWPYPKTIAPRKMKLAMQVGRHYSLKEIQPRHFQALARACRYPGEVLLTALKESCVRLPDEGSTLVRELHAPGMSREILGQLQNGLTAQCKTVAKALQAPASAAAATADSRW
jgi:serine/threonine-protein kinase HipA